MHRQDTTPTCLTMRSATWTVGVAGLPSIQNTYMTCCKPQQGMIRSSNDLSAMLQRKSWLGGWTKKPAGVQTSASENNLADLDRTPDGESSDHDGAVTPSGQGAHAADEALAPARPHTASGQDEPGKGRTRRRMSRHVWPFRVCTCHHASGVSVMRPVGDSHLADEQPECRRSCFAWYLQLCKAVAPLQQYSMLVWILVNLRL